MGCVGEGCVEVERVVWECVGVGSVGIKGIG